MTVGALCDLGVPPEHLLGELEKLGLTKEFHAEIRRDQRQHISGLKFDVHEKPHTHAHPFVFQSAHHSHGPETHVHGRTHREIQELLTKSLLTEFVKEKSLAVFQRIAIAEGKIHGIPPEDVGFHEVGAVDSIVDIVAACVAIEYLKPAAIYASELFEGSGSVKCAHGSFPLPAPATLEILRGIPLKQIAEPMEFITPTGAALIAEFASSFSPMPSLTPEKIGYGLGTRDTSPRPNVLRVILGEGAATSVETDEVLQVETNLDDLSPELLAPVLSSLLAAGALDAFFTPIQMKKGRPAWLLSFLCEEGDLPKLTPIVFRETSAFGLRTHRVQRQKLVREFSTIDTLYGPIQIKRGYWKGALLQLAPEFDSCAAAAAANGVPVREVYAAACAQARSML